MKTAAKKKTPARRKKAKARPKKNTSKKKTIAEKKTTPRPLPKMSAVQKKMLEDMQNENGTYTVETKERYVIKMLKEDIAANEMSKQTGISQPTLSRWCRRVRDQYIAEMLEENVPPNEISKKTGIPQQTLSKWRRVALANEEVESTAPKPKKKATPVAKPKKKATPVAKPRKTSGGRVHYLVFETVGDYKEALDDYGQIALPGNVRIAISG